MKNAPTFIWVDTYIPFPPTIMNQISCKDENNYVQAYASVIRKNWNFYPN